MRTNESISQDMKLHRLLELCEKIYSNTRPRLSATLHYRHRHHKGEKMATLRVGQQGNPVYQEWAGPNGTGDKLPSAGPVVFVSSDPSVSVDSNSGVITGVAVGNSTITATDATDNMVAKTSITVVEVATSATLDYVPV